MKALLAKTGFLYFPLAFFARFPFSMMSIGAMTIVVSARESIELGGWNAAAIGVGMTCFGPLIGAAADRFGQKPTLLIIGTVHSALLGTFVWLAFSTHPDWVMLLAAFAVGATGPQTSPMSRSRLVTIATTQLPLAQRGRAVNSALAYESAVDEVIYVFGPVTVGLLASLFGAGAPLIASATMTFIFVTLFALHRTSEPPKSREERAATVSPVSALLRPIVLVTVAGAFTTGMFFGSTMTALMSVTSEQGRPEAAGLLFGVMGVGSAILAISVAWFPSSFTLRYRWIVSAAVIVVGGVLIQTADGIPALVFALVIMGLGVGPLLVTIFGFAAARTPEGRSATVMSMIGTGIMLGQSLTAAITGNIGEQHGSSAALYIPLASAALILLTGFVNFRLSAVSEAEAREVSVSSD